MKQVDPNHYIGIEKAIEPSHEPFNASSVQKLVIYAAKQYMKMKTKRFLNFEYTGKPVKPAKPDNDKNYLLYLHIPFCKTLCPYCSFHKFRFQEEQARIYFRLLRKEMELIYQQGFNFVSLYIGGGTTTILPDELLKTIEFAKDLFDIQEVSCEGDPLIDEAMVEMLSGSVDRLSVGIQTTDDAMLKKIKRYKKFGSSHEQLHNLSKAIGRFPIVNVDLIFNLPGQTESMLRKDLKTISALNPEQISIYPLMYSPSVKTGMEKSMGKIDDSDEADFYTVILESLKDRYNQISSWAFSKKSISTFDEYVVDYNEYIGLGSGSFSFVDDTLYINTFSLKAYEEKINRNELSLERYKRYEKKDIIMYQLMLDFFSNNFNNRKYILNYNTDIEKEYGVMTFLMRTLKILRKGSYETTPFGKYFFLTLMKEFYIGMDYVRETSREKLTKEDKVLGVKGMEE